LAILTAVYTAFLFAQAEGRDLWQGALVPWHMFVQAAMAGSAALVFAAPFFGVDAQAARALTWTFGASALVNLLMTVGGELGQPHPSRLAAAASKLMTHGRYRLHFWGSVVAGLVLPLALCVLGGTSTFALSLASLLAIGGLLAYEWAFVMSAQAVPNS
jgi:Ni/Fe-hydrogenase subunit HybB-like protein